MLPANRDDRTVHVHRSLDGDEEDLLDAITAFAETQSLEIDRRHEGAGLLFCATTSGDLFKKGDALHVVITATDDGHDVEFTADLSNSVKRRNESGQGEAIRSGLWAAFFGVLAVRGVIPPNGLDVIDILFFGLAIRSGRRAAMRRSRAEEKIDELQRKVANELNAVCDEVERA